MWKTTEAREEGSCPFCIAGKMISGIAKANLGPTTFRERDPQWLVGQTQIFAADGRTTMVVGQ